MSVTDPPWSSPRMSIKFKHIQTASIPYRTFTEPRFSEELPVVSMLTGSKQYIEGYPLIVPDEVFVCDYCGKSLIGTGRLF